MTGIQQALTMDEVMRNQMTHYESREHIPLPVLDTIINNLDDIMHSREIDMKDGNGENMTIEQLRTLLNKYRINRRQNKTIIYKFAKKRSNGRLFSQTLSGQGISRCLRHTLFRENYIDIDIVNCHPVFLSWFCHQKGYVCEYLDCYIENRDTILNNLMTTLGQSKEQVKTLLLVLLNGGQLSNNCHEFINNFHKELTNILQNVLNSASPAEIKSVKKDNVAGSLLNRHLCCIENYVLKYMVEFFEHHGFSNMVLCFDGLMIDKTATSLLPELQNHLDLLCIPHLRVVIKDMNENIDLSLYNVVCSLPTNPVLDHDPDYNINDFELEFAGMEFKSRDELKRVVIPKYCKVFAHFRDFTTPVYRCQDNTFKIGWCNTDLYFWRIHGETLPFNIKNIVIQYPSYIPRYENYDFYPDGYNCYGDPCPPSILNLWGGFKATRLEHYDVSKIQSFLDHLLHMWADDDVMIYEYLLDYFASIIQFPWKKTKVLILLYSDQRAGKNTITNFFIDKVIGKEYGSDNVGVDILTKRFNEELSKQIFVVCNELPQLTNSSRNSIFDMLKTAITDDNRNYEIKGGRSWNGQNYINCICTTNHDFTYNIERNDGRILALKCSNRYIGDIQYFNRLYDNLKQDNADHLITFLYERQIKHDLTNIPMTTLKKEMIEMSLPSSIRFINHIKNEPFILDELIEKKFKLDFGMKDKIEDHIKKNKILSSHLYQLYDQWCNDYNESKNTHTAFSKILKNDCMLKREHTRDGSFFCKFW